MISDYIVAKTDHSDTVKVSTFEFFLITTIFSVSSQISFFTIYQLSKLLEVEFLFSKSGQESTHTDLLRRFTLIDQE